MEPSEHPTLQALRPLLPRVSPREPEQPPPVSPTRRIKARTAAACRACRERKSKCNGERPTCGACNRHRTDCQYETATDETRSQALKRKVSELHSDVSVHAELIDLLRSRPDRDVGAIIQRVRAGEDIESIVRFVKEGDLLLQNHLRPSTEFRYQIPFVSDDAWIQRVDNGFANSNLYRNLMVPSSARGLPPDAPAASRQMYRVPYHFARLIEPRIGFVRASMWTNVTASDDLVQRLLETYFVHEFPSTFFFHKDYFLKDMAAGRKRFCSSLLVNAVLACGWHGFVRATDRVSHWKPQSLGYQFLAEAKRLWELQDNKFRLTTVQAGAVISVVCTMNGMDRIGRHYLAQAVDLLCKMDLNTMISGEGLSPCRKTVSTITTWAVYSWQSIQNFYLRRAPMMAEPPLLSMPSYEDAPEFFGEIWVQYPAVETPVPCHHGRTACAHVGIRCILNKIGLRRFSTGKASALLSAPETLSFQNELQRWYDSLPSPLTVERAFLPSHLTLHIHFYDALIRLCLPYRSIEHTQLETGQHFSRPERTITHAMSCIGTILRLYYSRHGFEYLDNLVAVLLASIGFFFADEFSRGASAGSPDEAKLITALLCGKGLHDQADCYLLAEAFFWVLRDHLPPESRNMTSIFPRIENEEARKNQVARHVRSDWPTSATSTAGGSHHRRLNSAMRSYTDTSPDASPDSSPDASPVASTVYSDSLGEVT